MIRAAILTATAACLLAVPACSGDDAAGPPATSTPSDRGTGTSEPAPADRGGGQCPVGEYEVTKIAGKAGADVNGVPIVATSGGGLELALTEAGTWTLTGDGASVTLKAANISVTGTVDGSAEGSYAKAGNDYVFKQEKASGKVTLDQPVVGVSSIPMADVGPALAPGGTATLTCSEGGLRIASESVTLDLTRTGGPTGGAPTTPTGSGGGASGGTLTIADSAQTRTIDCAGRAVAINGSSNTLTFTGSCATVTVNGSKNEVTLEQVTEIGVNGSLNIITWSGGDPKVSDNGTGNKITQG
ncbi:MAG TPA: DUF3060 domain-containing protein [Actinophytocola sp.]|uniref:DUF3060 domain-containing protein n=1 Tax=Actinophytocola sp. TaxID=1872138 RepID=UPI002DDCA503|nr:DUF3060 domain-containing protein [Actinophytocola sp.]HEV2783148.1 DUF3060 domain-containing protein [Actinophytocola sp.]